MTDQSNESLIPPSKRAARRIIQRAFVLTGRDKHLRQQIRSARLATLWILEDWDMIWTVFIDRGKLEFERRPTKHPDLIFNWQNASDFFLAASNDLTRAALTAALGQSPASAIHGDAQTALTLTGNVELRRLAGILLHCFLGQLGHVLRNPVDGVGESLL